MLALKRGLEVHVQMHAVREMFVLGDKIEVVSQLTRILEIVIKPSTAVKHITPPDENGKKNVHHSTHHPPPDRTKRTSPGRSNDSMRIRAHVALRSAYTTEVIHHHLFMNSLSTTLSSL